MITAIDSDVVANQIGIEGGAIMHQVTPWMPRYDRPSEKRKIFAHVFAMFGVVDSSGIEYVDRTTSTSCDDQMLGGDYELMMLPATNAAGPALSALRNVATSSTPANSVFSLGTRRPCSTASRVRPPCSRGSCSTNSRHGPTWPRCREPGFTTRSAPGVKRRPSRNVARISDATKSEDGDELRQGACQCENFHKHRDREDRRRELAVIALPFFQKFKDAGGKHLGSPALRKMLSEAGHNISDRDARWLAKNLPSMDKRTVREKAFAVWTLHKARCSGETRTNLRSNC